MSVGFGSSAAFCTALLRAVGFDGDEAALWAEAHRIERVFHGTPSGIDTGLSIYEGVSIVYPVPPGLPTREPATLPAAWIVFGALPRTRPTADLVAGIRLLRDHDPNRVDGALERLGELSRLAVEPGRCPDAAALGALADEAQRTLRSLGLSTTEMDTVLESLRAAGATGAKLSGAGGGGAFYAVFQTEFAARAAQASVRMRARKSVRILHLDVAAIGDARAGDGAGA
jgi:mevalonate kinase